MKKTATTYDTVENTCQHCGEKYTVKERNRVYGNNPQLQGYCSAGCYTQALFLKEPATPVKDEGYTPGELPKSLTLLVTGTGYRSSDHNKETLLLRTDDDTVHFHKEAHPHIIHNMVDRYNEHERLLAANKELVEALAGIVENWDSKMLPDREQYKETVVPGTSKPFSYWSPAASLVDSSKISAARSALQKAKQ